MKHNFKKATSWLLTLAMIVTMLPAGTLTAFAAEDTGLCEHHPAHTAECGYVAAAAEVPCGHEHTAECYTLGELPDADSGDVYDLGADTNALACQHVHDAECGYIAAVEAHECHYECAECAAPACTCGTEDESIHATDCPAYVAPETAVCTCVEQCTEGNANVWCDVCGFDASACTGTDMAAAYADSLTVNIDTDESVILYDTNGDGYYEIGTADELYAFAALVNGGKPSINGKLTANIIVNTDISDSNTNRRVWTPIGNATYMYTGIFDGDNKTISGLYYSNSATYGVGLFGYVGYPDGGSTVKNVGVVSSYFSGSQNVGGVVGSMPYGGTVENCYSSASVSGTAGWVGGVVGSNSTSTGTVRNCYNTGSVSGTNANVGGVVGSNTGTVENCYNTGNVSGTTATGGVVGAGNSGSDVKNCYNTGTVTGSWYTGGVVGGTDGTVTNCYYLKDCATDGSGVAQQGIGAANQGSTTEDVEDGTVTTGYYDFSTGEVAWLLNGETSDGVWKQTLGDNGDATPNFTGSTVYYGYTSCLDEVMAYTNEVASKTKPHDWENGRCMNYCGYTHTPHTWSDGICSECHLTCEHSAGWANGVCNECGAAHDPHSYTNGICTVCGGYEPAVRVTAENYEELGFTAENYAGYLKYYAIGNAGQLYWFADYVTEEQGYADAVLTDNIVVNLGTFDASGNYTPKDSETRRDWTPIGDANFHYQYYGTFDGQNHTISGLYFNDSTAEYVGLFGWVYDGTVKNVGVVDSYLCGKGYVGGVVGCLYADSDSASVENCYNTGIVNGTSNNVGGVVGHLYANAEGGRATVTNCYNTGNVSGNPPDGYYSNYIGGVVGANMAYSGTATVANCYNTGNVSSSGGSYYVGGVAGDNYTSNNGTATIENCYYLTNCATDGEVYQNGIGANGSGNTTADVEGEDGTVVTAVKDEVAFKSGEVAYLLNGSKSEGVWKQTLGEGGDASPNFTGKTVYQSGTGYTNHEHNWSYEASGNQIQATCTAAGCTLTGSVTITLTALAGTYDGTTAYTARVSDNPPDVFTVSDDEIEYTANDEGGELTNGLPVNAGSYTATLTLGEGTDAKTATVTYTIAPKDITNATAGTFGDLTYTGEAQTPSATVTLDGKTVTGSWSAVTNVGEESTFTASGNYTGTLKGDPGMKPKDISITGATIEDVLYNENGGYTLNVTGVTFDGATLTIGTAYTASAVLAGTNQIADNVAATVTVTLNNGNYSLSQTTFKGSVNIITHTHVWSYSASENVITAKCGGEVGTCPVDDGTVTITLVAPTGTLVFDTSVSKEVTVTQSPKGVFSDLPAVKYTVMYEDDSEYSDAADTIGAGSYKATLTLGTATAEVTFTIDRATISTVTLNVTDPEQGAEPQSTVASAVGYGAYIDWDPEETKFGFNTAYTATVTLSTDGNHQFADNIAVDGWTVKEGSTPYKLILTKTFPATRKAELQSVTAPTFEKFSEYHETAANAITELPTQVAYGTESGNVNAEIQWTCENYNPATVATNTFTWTVKDGELADYANTNTIATTGTITVTNADAIAVSNNSEDDDIIYNGNTYDVAQMFTKDTNAGEATYSIVGGTGEGTLDGSTLTIAKAGTIEIKMTTAAKDPYAAGEATATLTVNKGTGSGTVTMDDWTYGETAKAPVPTSTTNGTANVTYRYTDDNGYNSETVPTDAGTYTVTATFAATDLYEAATAEDTFTISPIKITASISGSVTKPYDGGTSVPNDHQLSITLSGVLDADKAYVSATATYTYDGADVGTTTIKATDITLSGDKAKNYELTATTVSADSGTITKVESTCTPPDDIDTLVFNGNEQALITAGTAIGGEMQYKLGSDGTWGTEIPKGKNAGNYKVFYRVVGDKNHEDDSGGSVVVIIKQAAAPTVTIDKQSFIRTIATMGNTVDIAAKLPDDRGETSCANLDLSDVEDIVSENLTFLTPSGSLTFGTMTSETAKSGKITFVVLMENYATTTVEVEIELTDKTPLSITGAAAVTGLIYNGEGQLGYTGTPVAEGYDGDFIVTYSGRNGTTFEGNGNSLPVNAGDYTVTFAIPDEDLHYTGQTSVDFTIGKASVTIKAEDKSAYRGSEAPAYTYVVTGLIGTDELLTEPTITCEADMSTNGTYAIVPSGAAADDNYSIGYENGTLTVRSRPSSSGGGSTPNTPTTSVTIPISGDENTINVDASVKGEKATVDEVDLDHLDTVIGDDVSTGTVTIDFSGLDSKEPITSVEIPSDVVKQIAEAVNNPANDAESMEVILSDGTSIEFDAVALGEKAAQAGGLDITISIENHENVDLTSAQKNAVGDRVAYDINVTSGGKHISDMGGKITVHAPYELKPGEKAHGIVVWYVDDNGNRERCETSYDPIKKRVNWKTDHLSLYMIDYDETLAETCPKDDTCPVAAFTDADPGAWYHDGIHYALENGMMAGYGNGLFGTNDSITRGQIVTILWRLEGSPVVNYLMNFEDVPAEKYYTEAIRWANSQGIVGGYGNGKFGPDDPITRQQLATMVYRYEQYKGGGFTGAWAFRLDFKDLAQMSDYAYEPMSWCVMHGIVGGYGNGYLGPNDGATRAQAAAMLMRYCTLNNEEN